MQKSVMTIIGVLVLAGCVGQTGGQTQVDIADVLVAENQPVIPASPTAGSDFTVRMSIRNQHGTETANNVKAWLFDSGKCVPTSVNGLTPAKETEGYNLLKISEDKTVTTFSPGQQELVSIDFGAPTSQEIVGLSAVCPIRYKVQYTFDAKSEMSFDVASLDRLKQIETETGERPTAERRLNVGAGPIRISLEPKTTLPVQEYKNIPVEIIVKNAGTGSLPAKGVLAEKSLVLIVPNEIASESSETPCGDYFVKIAQAAGAEGASSETKYELNRPVQLVKGETNPITCTFKAPKVQLEKQFTISAQMLGYTYEYFGQQIDVTIRP